MKVLCLVLSLVSILEAANAATRRAPFRSAKASRGKTLWRRMFNFFVSTLVFIYSETVENYEEFMPTITSGDDHKVAIISYNNNDYGFTECGLTCMYFVLSIQPYPQNLRVSVHTQSQHFSLVLQMNQ